MNTLKNGYEQSAEILQRVKLPVHDFTRKYQTLASVPRFTVILFYCLLLALLPASSIGQWVKSVSLNPPSVLGGGAVTGTVTLTKPAAGILKVSLASDSSYATVPASLQIQTGESSAKFSITTKGVNIDSPAIIRATGNGSASIALLTVQAPKVASLIFPSATVEGGKSITGTLQLTGVAPVGGLTVWMSWSDPTLEMPLLVNIPAGSKQASFTVTSQVVAANVPVTIGAYLNGSVVTFTVTVLGPLALTLSVSPASITAGQNANGKVVLSSGAPAGGVTISLAATGTGVSLPKTLNIAAAGTTGSFTITTTVKSVGTSVISAGLNGKTVSANLKISPGVGLMNSAWPKYGGNARNTGQSVYSGATGVQFWKAQSTTLASMNAPAVGSDGTIYVVDESGVLYAYQSNGSRKWLLETNSATGSAPAIAADGTIYIASNDGLRAVSSDGKLKWYFAAGRAISSPNIGKDGTIYFGNEDANFYAVNPNGTKKWAFKTRGNMYCTPAIAPDDSIVFGIEGATVYSLKPDGSLKWTASTTHVLRSAPTIDPAGNVYIGCWDGFLYSYNSSGGIRWKVNTGSAITWAGTSLGTDGTVFVGSSNKNLYALNSLDGSLKWSFATKNTITSSVAIGADGTVYLPSDDGYLYALSSAGGLKWKLNLGDLSGLAPEGVSSPAIGVGGVIYAGTGGGILYAIK